MDSSDDEEVPWHAIDTPEEVVEELVSTITQGLTQSEAARRLGIPTDTLPCSIENLRRTTRAHNLALAVAVAEWVVPMRTVQQIR
jgi:hypothetical protein